MKLLIFIFLFLSSVCFADNNLELLVSPEEISKKIKEVAATIDQQYADQDLTVIMVMKGAVCVTSDLIRQLHIPVTLEYMKASSYGKNGTSRGELRITGLDTLDLTNKNILVIDDIFDSGFTMETIVQRLQEKKPKSVKTLVLLAKKIPRETSYRPDFTLFEIGNRFIVGYGLDYKEHYRGLNGVYAFINDTPPAVLN